MANFLQKLSFGQSLKARLGYVWTGIWSTAEIAAVAVTGTFYNLFSGSGFSAASFSSFLILLPFFLSAIVAGVLIGGLVGLGLGIVQAVTRVPRLPINSFKLNECLEKIGSNDRDSHIFIQTVIREYESKSGIRSSSSKALIRELKSESDVVEKLHSVKDYLYNYDDSDPFSKLLSPGFAFVSSNHTLGTDNKGKRLDNILRETLMKYEDYLTREIQKNTRMFAFLQRKGHPCFSKMPKDILLMTAAMTNPDPHLTQQEALDIATTTYNDTRHGV